MIHSGKIIVLGFALTCAPVAAQQTEPSRAAQVAAAEDARADGNFDLARRILEIVLNDSPDDPDLMRRLAMAEANGGQLAAARARIEAASVRSPDDLDIALARGYILYWSGRFDEAENVSAAISARAPDYPELAALQASIARRNDANRLKLRALTINASLSGIKLQSGASSTWSSQGIVASIDVSSKNRLILAATREARRAFDTRLSARLEHRVSGAIIYAQATAVPSPDFQENWSFAAGGEVAAQQRLTIVADGRYADFETGSVIAVQPGLRIAFTRKFSLTGKAISLFDDARAHRLGASLRLDYHPDDVHSLFAIGASYPDVEADGVQQMRSMAIGFAFPISDSIRLSSTFSHESRENSYRRWTGNLGLSFRYGAQ